MSEDSAEPHEWIFGDGSQANMECLSHPAGDTSPSLDETRSDCAHLCQFKNSLKAITDALSFVNTHAVLWSQDPMLQ